MTDEEVKEAFIKAKLDALERETKVIVQAIQHIREEIVELKILIGE